MTKKKYIFFIAIISIILCACSNVDDTNTIRYSELMHACESDELVSIENIENIEQKMETNVSETVPSQILSTLESESVNSESTQITEKTESINDENTEQKTETNVFETEAVPSQILSTLEGESVNSGSTQIVENTESINTEQKAEAKVSDTDFFTSKSTSSFEYDSVNNTITIDGIVYTIATSEVDYSGGYMPYFIVNSNVEDIMNSINNNDLTNKYWRDGIPDELQEKVDKSTLLESFVNGGGKILDYYIINGNFYHSANDAEVPVILQYSYNEATYYTIWVFYIQAFVEAEVDVQYQITDIFQLDNLDGYTQ